MCPSFLERVLLLQHMHVKVLTSKQQDYLLYDCPLYGWDPCLAALFTGITGKTQQRDAHVLRKCYCEDIT